MYKPTTTKAALALLFAVLLFSACQKTDKTISQQTMKGAIGNQFATGAVPDDTAILAKVPIIMSSDFMRIDNQAARKGNTSKDSDGDGIPDNVDACPTKPETFNGYQDNDGCPDTAPPTTAPDTDGDGIPDAQDGCPTQPETFNGYMDGDGCPDTPPVVVLPPTTLPTSYQLQMPPVGHQGSEGSCVAWATSYARSCEAYYKTNATSYSQTSTIFSPEFIYNQTKLSEDCGSGTAFSLTLDLLAKQGVCSWMSMPYDPNNGCSLLPTASQNTEALNYKIGSYSTIIETDQSAIKDRIVNKHPVMVTVNIDANFRNAYPGYIWNSYAGFSGCHAVVICGYDDAKHAYKVMNCWGTNWGDAGYTWIDYDFFPTVSSYYVYVIN